jgi:uncharacterized membrane protein (UPF0127 family)
MLICYKGQKQILTNIRVADSVFSRMKGLIGKSNLNENHGLLIKPCKQVHTFFMKFPIDCIFLNGVGEVVYIIEGLTPWEISKYIPIAEEILETPHGTVSTYSISIGDRLTFKD